MYFISDCPIVCSFGYSVGLFLEIKEKINCTLTDPALNAAHHVYPYCGIDDLTSTGKEQGENALKICIAVIVILSCFKSMLIAALPALAGDQVRCRIVVLTLQLGVHHNSCNSMAFGLVCLDQIIGKENVH